MTIYKTRGFMGKIFNIFIVGSVFCGFIFFMIVGFREILFNFEGEDIKQYRCVDNKLYFCDKGTCHQRGIECK